MFEYLTDDFLKHYFTVIWQKTNARKVDRKSTSKAHPVSLESFEKYQASKKHDYMTTPSNETTSTMVKPPTIRRIRHKENMNCASPEPTLHLQFQQIIRSPSYSRTFPSHTRLISHSRIVSKNCYRVKQSVLEIIFVAECSHNMHH